MGRVAGGCTILCCGLRDSAAAQSRVTLPPNFGVWPGNPGAEKIAHSLRCDACDGPLPMSRVACHASLRGFRDAVRRELEATLWHHMLQVNCSREAFVP